MAGFSSFTTRKGGSVAEWSERRTFNPEAPSSSPALGPVARSMVSVNQRLIP